MLLPQPLSPTRPTVLPRGIVKLTPSTAVMMPSSVANCVRRSRIFNQRLGAIFHKDEQCGLSHRSREAALARPLTQVLFAGGEGFPVYGIALRSPAGCDPPRTNSL